MHPFRVLCAALALAAVAALAAPARADERIPCAPGRVDASCVAQPSAQAIDLHDRGAVAKALRRGVWLAGVQPPPGPVSQAALDAYLARIFLTGPH